MTSRYARGAIPLKWKFVDEEKGIVLVNGEEWEIISEDDNDEDYEYIEEVEKEAYEIYSEDGTFYVEGPLIDYLVYITNFEDYLNF